MCMFVFVVCVCVCVCVEEEEGHKRGLDRTLPEAMILMCSRRPEPMSIWLTKTSPSTRGMPNELLNSGGAAPVPPSDPSKVMKSGYIPVASMACTMDANSAGWPTQSLKPIGLPSERPATPRLLYTQT